MANDTVKISLRTAVERGIAELRRDPWEPSSHIALHIDTMPDGKKVHGPWVMLHGIGILEDGTAGQTETPILCSELDWDEEAWEAWAASPGS